MAVGGLAGLAGGCFDVPVPPCAGVCAQLTKCRVLLPDELRQQRGFGSISAVTKGSRNGGARGRRTRAVTDMSDVPEAGGDATGYGATCSNGLGKPGVLDQKCRATNKSCLRISRFSHCA